MKKVILLLFIVLSSTFIYALNQKKISNLDIKISPDFEWKNPTEAETLIPVIFPGSNDEHFFIAYKGETKESFLIRINKTDNFIPIKKNHTASKDSLEGKKIMLVDKNQIPPMKPIYWVLIIFLGLLTTLSPRIVKKLNRREKEREKRKR